MVAALALFANLGGSRPARLVLVQAPIAGNQSAVIPAPIIEVQDASGRRVRDAEIEVHVVAVEDSTSLLGTRTVTTAGGMATFNNVSLAVNALGLTTLRFSAEGLEPVTVTLGSPVGSTLWLDHAELNGQELTPDHRVVTISPGEAIRGEVTLRYSAYWTAASVILGAFPNWGDKRESFATISALPTPVVDVLSRHSLNIVGPDRPGDYSLILAFAAETDARWIASGTNWAVGTPMWDDGNDLADLPPSKLEEARRRGQVLLDWYFLQVHTYDPLRIATTVIDVRVR